MVESIHRIATGSIAAGIAGGTALEAGALAGSATAQVDSPRSDLCTRVMLATPFAGGMTLLGGAALGAYAPPAIRAGSAPVAAALVGLGLGTMVGSLTGIPIGVSAAVLLDDEPR